MKKILTLVFILSSLSFCSAIAIIAPAVYVATLSITAFLANTIVTIAIFIAAKSFSNKNTLTKGVSTKIGFALELIGKILLLLASTTIAILIVNPILIQEAIYTGILAAIICGAILFLYNYKKISISEKETKKNILLSAAIFCIFVFISSSFVGYFSIETKAIVINGQGVEQSQTLQSPSPLMDIAENFVSNKSQSASAPSQGIQKEATPTQLLIFYPNNLNECVISSTSQNLRITPTNNCFSSVEGITKRIICPIVIDAKEFTSGSKVNSSGSCSETYTVE